MLCIDLFFKNHSIFLISPHRSGYDFNLFHKYKNRVYLETAYVFDSGHSPDFTSESFNVQPINLYLIKGELGHCFLVLNIACPN